MEVIGVIGVIKVKGSRRLGKVVGGVGLSYFLGSIVFIVIFGIWVSFFL